MRPHLKAGVAAVALALLGFGATRLLAQTPRNSSRRGLIRNPAVAAKKLTPQQKAAGKAQIQAQQVGLVLLFEYDDDLAKDLDLDDNGTFTDNGDRALREGDIWLSNRNAARIRRIGRFVSEFQYFDVTGEDTGTDLTQVTDMFFEDDGQARASGFWNVPDGAGSPALHIDGATGLARGVRRYVNGQLFLLDDEVDENEELWFLAR
jgi:hypothetical protein